MEATSGTTTTTTTAHQSPSSTTSPSSFTGAANATKNAAATSSITRITSKYHFPILVCSANLGNARPDVESLHSWIPDDGRCEAVVTSDPQYPLPPSSSNDNSPAVAVTPNDQFVIIAIGMQEATWDPPLLDVGALTHHSSNSTKAPPPKSSSLQSMEMSSSMTTTGGPGTSEPSLHDHDNDTTSANLTEEHHALGGLEREVTLEAIPSNGGPALLAPPLPRPVSRRRSVTHLMTKPLQKAVRSVRGLTANRDHTKRQRPQPQQPPSSSNNALVVSSDLDASADAIQQQQSQPPTTKPSSQQKLLLESWDFGTQALHRMLETRLPSYKRVVSFQRGEMRLEIFVLRKLVDDETNHTASAGSSNTTTPPPVQVLHVTAQNTGRAGLANKGGIVAELLVYQTRLAFVSCHLEAHEGRTKYEIRCNTMTDIFQGTKSNKLHDVSLTSHYAFVLGDLNFRTELDPTEYTSVDEHKRKVREMVEQQDWESLNRIDELHRALRGKDCLVGFRTLPCHFPPTFKVGRQAGYHYVDKRRPSYTDRILWKGPTVQPLSYEPIDDFTSSDHKPVRGAFLVPTHSRLRMRPRMSRFGTLERSFGWTPLMSTRSRPRSRSVVAHKNKLFLFVSQIQCQIDRKSNGDHGGGNATPPSPYVLLVSYPDAACRQKVRWWNKIKSLFRFGHTASLKNPDGSELRLAFGWPRSSLKRHTFEPEWIEDNEELQCQIQTHAPDGSPIDLTGCMLRITLMNDTKNEDPVIGTVQYNLAELLRKCIGPDGMSSVHNISNRQVAQSSKPQSATSLFGTGISMLSMPNTSNGQVAQSSQPPSTPASAPADSGVAGVPAPSQEETDALSSPPPPPQPPIEEEDNMAALASADIRYDETRISRRKSQMHFSATRRSSILNIFGHTHGRRRSSAGIDNNNDDDDDDLPIVMDVIHEPLLKNGRQVGTIHCKIEAWWMNQYADHSYGASLSEVGGGGATGSGGGGGSHSHGDKSTLLTARHNELLKHPPPSPKTR